MIGYILKRIIAAVVSMFVLITVTFFLMHAIPGGPFSKGEEKNVPPRVLEALRARYGLDLPLWQQYTAYLKRLVRGDLGDSFKKLNYTVNELIAAGFPASATAGAWAVLTALIAGIPLGITAAIKRGGWADWLSMILATIGISMPVFIIAMLLMYIFSMQLGWLPVYGYGTARHLVIPVVCLALSPIAYITRLMRSSMMEVTRQDYIRTARAKGLSEFTVITRHALRNAITPVITYIGPLLAALLTGSFVVESLFMVPGIGKYFVSAVSERDYSVILGLTIFYGGFIMLSTLLVDIACALIDPRMKFGGDSARAAGGDTL